MRAAFIAALVVLARPAMAAPPQWTWEAGKQTHNGAISIKSVNGGTTHSGTQNPTGAVAKTNQNAVTQPSTVIIQATGGSLPFNYKDDCWIFDLDGHKNRWFIGAGKVDVTTSKFSGIMGYSMGTNSYGFAGGHAVLTALLGAGGGGAANTFNPYWCGSDVSCAFSYAGPSSNFSIVVAAALPILTYQKCYP